MTVEEMKTGFVERIGGTIFVVNAMPAKNAKHTQEELVKALIAKEATLKNLFKQDREKFVVPKSVQNVIPIKTIWEDGIFLVGRNKYAKTFKFEDINYAVASREDKEAMFLEYSELLNSLDSGATTKITINNRRLNKADFEQTILIPMADDGLDKYRKVGGMVDLHHTDII